MDAVVLESLKNAEMTVDRFGIRVPRNRRVITPDALDMVIVPGLAYDPHGHRLGQGGGFYDRYLKSLPELTTRVGACFSIQLISAIPTEHHDEPVHLVVTERDVHRAG